MEGARLGRTRALARLQRGEWLGLATPAGSGRSRSATARVRSPPPLPTITALPVPACTIQESVSEASRTPVDDSQSL